MTTGKDSADQILTYISWGPFHIAGENVLVSRNSLQAVGISPLTQAHGVTVGTSLLHGVCFPTLWSALENSLE